MDDQLSISTNCRSVSRLTLRSGWVKLDETISFRLVAKKFNFANQRLRLWWNRPSVNYGCGIPRSRQIFRAKKSLISRCRGTALV